MSNTEYFNFYEHIFRCLQKGEIAYDPKIIGDILQKLYDIMSTERIYAVQVMRIFMLTNPIISDKDNKKIYDKILDLAHTPPV